MTQARRALALAIPLCLALFVAAPTAAIADDGSGSEQVPSDAGVPIDAPSATPDAATTPNSGGQTVEDLPSNEDLAKRAYDAVFDRNWFMIAGVALSLLIKLVWWQIKRKWPTWEGSRYGVVVAAGTAAVVALAFAWIAEEPVASSTTWLGALKLLAVAVAAHVIPKKLSEPPVTAYSGSK